jgi:hypothetical protein
MDTCAACIINFFVNIFESGVYYVGGAFKYYVFSPLVAVFLFLIL